METRPVEHLVTRGDKNLATCKTEFVCTCGAHWTVTDRELDEGIDHIEDHYRYANRPLIKPD
jgi:hypothetical protein